MQIGQRLIKSMEEGLEKIKKGELIPVSNVIEVKAFKTDPEAIIPVYSTQQAACFDIFACVTEGKTFKTFSASNQPSICATCFNHADGIKQIIIKPFKRCLVPTGIIFDIPEGYSIRLHPRSGLSLKKGIVLGNCEGVIDSDYVDPTFVMIFNNSSEDFVVSHGDRICQGEIVPVYRASFSETENMPLKRSDREGGFGSTGV